jgi:hypothetical protein
MHAFVIDTYAGAKKIVLVKVSLSQRLNARK